MDNSYPVLPSSQWENAVQNLLRLIELNRDIRISERKMETLVGRIYRCRDTCDFNREKILLFYLSVVGPSDCRAHIPFEVVKKFIELGSNVNDQDERGRTILHWIAATKVRMMGYFMECGNVHGEDDFGPKLELINYLVEKGADVTLTDEDGNDPFKLLFNTAVQFAQPEVIITRFLDIIGEYDYADARRHRMVPTSPSEVLNQRNNAGFTCLYYILCRRCCGADVIKKLIELGADINVAIEYRSGESALHYALRHRFDFNISLLTILIPTNVELVTVNNNQSRRSSKILNLVITKDCSEIDSKIFEDFLDNLITAGFAIDEAFLRRAIRSSLRFKLVEVLMRKNVPITSRDIIEAIRFQRFDVALLLLDTIYETGKEKVQKIRTDHPGLLCESLAREERHALKSADVTIVDVMKVLLEKFGIDVNYSNEHYFILHSLVLRRNGDEDAILNYLVTNHPDLDIDKKVASVSALELALNHGSFKFAAKLMRNFASTANLHSFTPTEVGFTKCYQLLYQLGVDIRFEEYNSIAVQREVDWFNGWIDRQKVKVNSLTKLCSLVIRKNVSSRLEIEEITRNYLLPDKVVEMLTLTDEQESYVPPDGHDDSDNSNDYDDRSSEYAYSSYDEQ